jgi:hypothetical protein
MIKQQFERAIDMLDAVWPRKALGTLTTESLLTIADIMVMFARMEVQRARNARSRKDETITWPSGEPLQAGDVRPGSQIEFEALARKITSVPEDE